MRYFLFLPFLLCGVQICQSQNSFLNCPLIWTDCALGQPPPPYSIPATLRGNDHFIGRVLMNDGKYYAGRISHGKGFVVYENMVRASDYYQILTNPHQCILKWEDERTLQHLVPTDEGLLSYVGRSLVGTTFLSGQVEETSISLVSEDNTTVIKLGSYDLLTSYSKGLTLEMTKFDFGNHSLFGTKDLLGIDEIHNMADTEITQTFTHKKRIMESTTISKGTTWGRAFRVNFKITPMLVLRGEGQGKTTISGAQIEFEYAFENDNSRFESITREVTQEYSIMRSVTVAPYSSLQVCSTITMAEAVELQYTAQGRYSAPGLTAEQVAEILKEEGKEGFADGEAIIVEETGTFNANMGLMSMFITTPLSDLVGCSELATKIARFQLAKDGGKKTRAEMDIMAEDVDEVIKKLARAYK